MWAAFVIGISSPCFASDITVRVVNQANNQPLKNLSVTVAFHSDKQEDHDKQDSPASDKKLLTLTTDIQGEAHIPIPDPAPKQMSVSVDLSQNKWDCICYVSFSTEAIIQKGILEFVHERALTDYRSGYSRSVLCIRTRLSLCDTRLP